MCMALYSNFGTTARLWKALVNHGLSYQEVVFIALRGALNIW